MENKFVKAIYCNKLIDLRNLIVKQIEVNYKYLYNAIDALNLGAFFILLNSFPKEKINEPIEFNKKTYNNLFDFLLEVIKNKVTSNQEDQKTKKFIQEKLNEFMENIKTDRNIGYVLL